MGKMFFSFKLQNMHRICIIDILGKSLKSNTDLHCLNLPAGNLMPPLKRYHRNFGETSLVIRVCQDLFCRWFPLLTWDSSCSCTTWLAWKSLCYLWRDESCKTLFTYLMLVFWEEGGRRFIWFTTSELSKADFRFWSEMSLRLGWRKQTMFEIIVYPTVDASEILHQLIY